MNCKKERETDRQTDRQTDTENSMMDDDRRMGGSHKMGHGGKLVPVETVLAQ